MGAEVVQDPLLYELILFITKKWWSFRLRMKSSTIATSSNPHGINLQHTFFESTPWGGEPYVVRSPIQSQFLPCVFSETKQQLPQPIGRKMELFASLDRGDALWMLGPDSKLWSIKAQVGDFGYVKEGG